MARIFLEALVILSTSDLSCFARDLVPCDQCALQCPASSHLNIHASTPKDWDNSFLFMVTCYENYFADDCCIAPIVPWIDYFLGAFGILIVALCSGAFLHFLNSSPYYCTRISQVLLPIVYFAISTGLFMKGALQAQKLAWKVICSTGSYAFTGAAFGTAMSALNIRRSDQTSTDLVVNLTQFIPPIHTFQTGWRYFGASLLKGYLVFAFLLYFPTQDELCLYSVAFLLVLGLFLVDALTAAYIGKHIGERFWSKPADPEEDYEDPTNLPDPKNMGVAWSTPILAAIVNAAFALLNWLAEAVHKQVNDIKSGIETTVYVATLLAGCCSCCCALFDFTCCALPAAVIGVSFGITLGVPGVIILVIVLMTVFGIANVVLCFKCRVCMTRVVLWSIFGLLYVVLLLADFILEKVVNLGETGLKYYSTKSVLPSSMHGIGFCDGVNAFHAAIEKTDESNAAYEFIMLHHSFSSVSVVGQALSLTVSLMILSLTNYGGDMKKALIMCLVVANSMLDVPIASSLQAVLYGYFTSRNRLRSSEALLCNLDDLSYLSTLSEEELLEEDGIDLEGEKSENESDVEEREDHEMLESSRK